MSEDETKREEEPSLTLNKETMDVLVANIIPTSKYFEVRFDHMQQQINDVRGDLKDFRQDVDKRFEQVDKRFEQVDKRFEQVDQRFQHLEDKIDRLIERIDVKVDSGHRKQENVLLRSS